MKRALLKIARDYEELDQQVEDKEVGWHWGQIHA
jgi:hypothetical protein